jgi:hypothetical protein
MLDPVHACVCITRGGLPMLRLHTSFEGCQLQRQRPVHMCRLTPSWRPRQADSSWVAVQARCCARLRIAAAGPLQVTMPLECA